MKRDTDYAIPQTDHNSSFFVDPESLDKRDALLRNIKRAMGDAKYDKMIQTLPIRETIKQVIELMGRDRLVLDVNDLLRDYDESVYVHSIDVSVMSIRIGMMLGYNQRDLIELGTAGLLHDVGKSQLPREYWDIQNPTPEQWAIIQTHPILGFNVLKKRSTDYELAEVALQHHLPKYPVFDGEIHPHSKVVAVADVFSALTEERTYPRRMPDGSILNSTKFSVSQALEVLLHDAFNGKLDKDIVTKFVMYNEFDRERYEH